MPHIFNDDMFRPYVHVIITSLTSRKSVVLELQNV